MRARNKSARYKAKIKAKRTRQVLRTHKRLVKRRNGGRLVAKVRGT